MLRQAKTTKEKIGDNTYYIKPFPAFKSANISGELVSVLAPLLSAIVPLVSGNGSIADVDINEAATALMKCATINGEKVETLTKLLLLGGHITVEYENENGDVASDRLDEDLVNELFCGSVQDMFVLCIHVIRINFGGFFAKMQIPSGDAPTDLPKVRPIL